MGRMKLKKIPKKKKYKLLFLIIILYLFFAYTFYYSFKNDKKIMNEKFINFLLNNGSTHYIKELHLPKVINSTVKYLLKIDITDPTSLFKENILGYEIPEDDLDDIDRLREISYYMEDPNKEDISKPVVYIYNSHQLENYNNDNLSIYGITPNVLMASYLLKEKLNKSGIATIVEDTDLTEFLDLNKWNYANSYKASRMFILDKINTYDTIKYLKDEIFKNDEILYQELVKNEEMHAYAKCDFSNWSKSFRTKSSKVCICFCSSASSVNIC